MDVGFKRISFFFFCSLQVVFAQSPDTSAVLETAVVSASRVALPFSEAARSIVIITAEEIEHAPVQSVSDVLEYVVGLDVRRRGPMDVQTDVSIRGGTFEQTLILIDGIKMTDPQTGHHNMNVPISKDQIERIEVLEGGGSRIFGPNAFSGAINIITKKATTTGGRVDLMGGDFGLFAVGASGHHKGNYDQTTIAVRHDQSSGFRSNTDFQQTVFHLNSRLQLSKNATTDVQLGYNTKGFGAQNFYSTRFPEQFEATRTQFLSVKWAHKKAPNLSIAGYSRQHFDRFELFREGPGYYHFENGFFVRDQRDTAAFGPAAFYAHHNYHRTTVYGVDANFSGNNQLGLFAIGGEFRYEHIYSNNLGKPLDEPIAVRNSRGEYTLSDRRNNFSWFAEQHLNTTRWAVSAGMLVNYNTAFGWDWLPGVDMSYSFHSNSTLFGTWNRSFRLPSFTDLYYRLGGAQGSLDLQPEYSQNIELGWRTRVRTTQIDAAIFRKAGSGLIDWVVLPDDTSQTLRAQNITNVITNGFQVRTVTACNNTLLNRFQISYQHLFVEGDDFPFRSLYVLDFLTHKLVGSIQGTIPKVALQYDLKVNYQARRGDFIAAISGDKLPFPTVLLVDARISKHFFKERVRAYVEASNIGNQPYLDRGNIWLPGRWFRLGMQVTF